LRFLEGSSIAEAARALGISVSNAKVLQHRALRRALEIGARTDDAAPGAAAGEQS
jgi:DNA-directed RNA polymerase specialized sigma24 family protein